MERDLFYAGGHNTSYDAFHEDYYYYYHDDGGPGRCWACVQDDDNAGNRPTDTVYLVLTVSIVTPKAQQSVLHSTEK